MASRRRKRNTDFIQLANGDSIMLGRIRKLQSKLTEEYGAVGGTLVALGIWEIWKSKTSPDLLGGVSSSLPPSNSKKAKPRRS